ncbi:DEAD/DEAH box helicase [Bradyrhizobium sp. USDA 4471]
MSDSEPEARDLFGEPILSAKPNRRKRGSAPEPPAAEVSTPGVQQSLPVVRLRLPARFHEEGSVLGNPLRRLAFKQGYYEGTLEPVKLKHISAFRFTFEPLSSVLIVSKKTAAATGAEPLLLTFGAEDIDSILVALDRGECVWLAPRPRRPSALSEQEAAKICESVLASWQDQFSPREGAFGSGTTPPIPGLRKPQIGALYAALAHATSSTEPATIVMPTGTGKTETMLAIYAHDRISRLMVVVPTDALREQIANKMVTLGVLQEQQCLTSSIEYPMVLQLEHIPKSVQEVDTLFRRANVIVTTMSIAGKADPAVQERMAQLCGALFIDEAHHIKARTWREFRAWFAYAAETKPVYQFTATPFREDGGKVDGKFIYYYPLAKAQAEEYFGKVEFRAVSDLDGNEADDEIMRQVGDALQRDLKAGLNHLAMVRCKVIGRAEALYAKYAARYPQYNPVLVHSNQKSSERREKLAKLRRFESRLIVCVDMLGEGFDLPELKIAGVHDVFASVAVTLQFVGRFARARTDLGTATLIANTDQDRVDRALAKLYAEEADWNLLISTINADRVGREMERAAVFEGFEGDLSEIPLQTIEPSMNTLVFVARECNRWDPHRIEDVVPQGSFVGMKLNERRRIAVCVLRHETIAKWTASSTATDVVWELILVHWDEEKGILYISSTGGSATDTLAKAICGDKATRIRGQDVFRCFHEFRQLVIRNLGMTHRQGGGTRYSMLMGIDVSDGIDSLIRTERIQNNIFGSGFEDGEPRTLGCSIKGKFWSHAKVRDLTDWTRWCHRIGALLTNGSIPVSAAFASAMRPRQITERPDAHPLVIHWPMGVLMSFEERVELHFGGIVCPLAECDLVLTSHERAGPISFSVRSGDQEASFEVRFIGNEASYPQVAGSPCTIKGRRGMIPLAEYFADDAPQIDFGDGSFLIYSHLYVPPAEIDLGPVLDESLTAWDWKGTDIRVESQGPERRADSIQHRVFRELEKEDPDILFDDDGTGEFADVIAIKTREDVVEVLLCHCKFASSDKAKARLDDVYVVAGQALKSVQYCHKPKRFIRNMINRERRRLDRGQSTRFERGTLSMLRQLYSRWDQYRFEYRVWIVQPGVSKAAISQPILQLLGFVEKSLRDHRRIPLRVVLRP